MTAPRPRVIWRDLQPRMFAAFDPAAFLKQIQDDIARLSGDKPAPPRRGDKVEINVTGYVRRVHPDGAVDVATTPDPFAEAEYQAEARHVRVVERAKPKPNVGDVITGRELAAHPWRRGTIITWLAGLSSFVLRADGEWQHLGSTTGATYTFASLATSTGLCVDYLPGQ